MPKSDRFPELIPDLERTNLKGFTLYELYSLQELNTRNMAMLQRWLDNPATYNVWKDFDQFRKRLNRAIYLKRLKLWLLSLVGH